MKKYFVTVAIASMITVTAFAQDMSTANVPANVKAECLKKFPKSAQAKVAWEMEKGNYEANWGGKSGEDNAAMFSPAGVFLELVKAIPINQLPSAAIMYVKEHEKGATIKEAGLVTDPNGVVTYEAELKGKELIFDKNGAFMKSE
jgi:hypothetical protein